RRRGRNAAAAGHRGLCRDARRDLLRDLPHAGLLLRAGTPCRRVPPHPVGGRAPPRRRSRVPASLGGPGAPGLVAEGRGEYQDSAYSLFTENSREAFEASSTRYVGDTSTS